MKTLSLVAQLFLIPVCGWAATGQVGTASIAGSVKAGTGATVPGALVTVMAVPATTPPPATFTPLTTNAFAGSDGSFVIGNLPAGKFQLCAQTQRAAALLDPCLWSTTQTFVTLAAGQAVSSQTITLATGTLLRVHINDPGGLLLANDGKTPGAAIVLGVGGPTNILTPFFVDSTTATGRDQSLAVPGGAPLKLVIFSNFYRVTDPNGNSVTGTYSSAVSAAAGTVNLSITGVKAVSPVTANGVK